MSTIFAPITANFKSGICVIRISGEQTINCLKILGCKINLKPRYNHLQKLYDPNTNQLIDHALVSFYPSPHSYTGEDLAEISIHGSQYIAKKISNILLNIAKIEYSKPGEFSRRAFLNGKIDLVQAEAIPDLIACETEVQHQQAVKQLNGDLGKIYEQMRDNINQAIAILHANIDFPDDDIDQSTISSVKNLVELTFNQISNHLNDNKIGQKIKDGLVLVIIGSPNTGKSSLINFLANSDIAIVNENAGTTRDIIETHLQINGYPIKIADTAGIRITSNEIEEVGINRALNKAKNSDLKIYMIDVNNPEIDLNFIDQSTLIIFNKIDLIKNFSIENFLKKNNLKFDNSFIYALSLTSKINTDDFLKFLGNKIADLFPLNNNLNLTQERYRSILINCQNYLKNFTLDKNIEMIVEDLWITSNELGKITGRVDIDNILDIIFSKFCIGK
jgi:tRNA modification GTPase